MPRGVLPPARQMRAAAQIQAAQVRDVVGQVLVTETLANSINNAIDGTIVGTLQTKLNDLNSAIIIP